MTWSDPRYTQSHNPANSSDAAQPADASHAHGAHDTPGATDESSTPQSGYSVPPQYSDHPPFSSPQAAPYGPSYAPSYALSYGEGYPPYHYYPAPPPPPGKPSRGKRRVTVAIGAAAIAAALAVGGVAIADSSDNTVSGQGSAVQLVPTTPSSGGTSSGGTSSGGSTGNGNGSINGGGTSGGTTNGGGTSSTSVALASDSQKVGVVTIVSVLGYQNAEGAGTGMVLTSNGEILTNNHVVNGATSITVTVVSTGKSYRADVVGTDPTQDVAVIQLRSASGLQKAKIGDSADVKVGDKVIGVGNAGGTGVLRASSGAVTALNQSITASDEGGANPERLHGLIAVNAPIISGDSGGPMYDSSGEIIGMNTAASQSGATTGTAASAYAISIDSATSIANKIEAGVQTSTIHIGLPGFMGVGVATSTTGTGVAITSVLATGPAAKAGITEGSIVTKVDGKAVTSPTALKSALSGKKANSKVKVTWTGTDGASHSATVTLISGPAD